MLVEIGGTVGDIESLPFLEAIRQLRIDLGRQNTLYIHLTLVPYLETAGELKTKPTQHSVKELRSIGIQPDIIVCRSERELTQEVREKISLFCDVEPEAVIQNIDVDSIYEVPLLLEKEGLGEIVVDHFQLETPPPDLEEWREVAWRFKNPSRQVKVALVGKYVELHDAYMSIVEGLTHGGIANSSDVEIKWVYSADLEDDPAGDHLADVDGILVGPGFGYRGIEGKIEAAKYARENGVPYFGICLGLQCAVIEFARSVLGLRQANSTEFVDDPPHPVIALMPEQKEIKNLGGTMRLGIYPCSLVEGSQVHKIYGRQDEIEERHRHRFEFNNKYRAEFSAHGFKSTGVWKEADLVEIMELESHPWFIGTQFHSEYE